MYEHLTPSLFFSFLSDSILLHLITYLFCPIFACYYSSTVSKVFYLSSINFHSLRLLTLVVLKVLSHASSMIFSLSSWLSKYYKIRCYFCISLIECIYFLNMSSTVVPSASQTPTSGSYVPTILSKSYENSIWSFNIEWLFS